MERAKWQEAAVGRGEPQIYSCSKLNPNTSEPGRELQTSDEITISSSLSSAWQDSEQKTHGTQSQAPNSKKLGDSKVLF